MDTFYANLARQLRYMNRFHLFSFHNVLGGCFFLLKRCYLVVLSQENIEALILMVIFSTAMRQIQ